MAVFSPTVEENITKLNALLKAAVDWSLKHVCKFDAGKFQLVHYTRVKDQHTPTPVEFNGVLVAPVETAKYLGLILDRRLQWKEQAEESARKATSALLAIARLTGPTFGMPRRYIRQLYMSVVLPKMSYGLPVWFTPVISSPDNKHRSGSVGFARKLGKIQQVAACLMTGSFKQLQTPWSIMHIFHQ